MAAADQRSHQRSTQLRSGGVAVAALPKGMECELVVDAAEEPYGQKMQLVPMIGGSGPTKTLP